MSLFVEPRMSPSSGGENYSNAEYFFYLSGTTTPATVYSDSARTTPHTSPVVADSGGVFPPIWIDPTLTYRRILKNENGGTVSDIDPYPGAEEELAFPVSDAESNAGILVVDASLPYDDVRRFGVVANDTSARASNTSILLALFDPQTAFRSGDFKFPNESGADVYYLDNRVIDLRRGVNLDFCYSTIDIVGAYLAANDLRGFFTLIGPNILKNGSFTINYDGSSGTNNGIALAIGRRANPWGAFTDGIEEEDLSEPMGQISVSNLNITSNNPSGHLILLLGGLENVSFENIVLDGGAAVPLGIYYEWGHYHHDDAVITNRITSHANNLNFKNIRISNMKVTTPSEAFSLVGAMSATIDGLFIDGGYNGMIHRCGDALYYNKAPINIYQRAHIAMRNVVISNTASTAVLLRGAEAKSGGDLAGVGAVTEAKQCDLISFTLEDFSIDGSIIINGRNVILKNGDVINGGASGAILLQDELSQFTIDNVRVLDSANIGIRSQTSTNIFAVARFKQGVIRNCMVAGSNAQPGITINQSNGVLIEGCRFGYETIHDGVAETLQTNGVSVQSLSLNTTIRNCYGGGSTGVMYTNATSGGWKFAKLESPGGVKTIANQWTIDGNGMDADIGDADTTLTYGTDLPTQQYATILGANRTVTLSAGAAGARFRIVRTGLGAWDLIVTGIKTITGAVAAFIDVEHDGTAWRLTGYGLL